MNKEKLGMRIGESVFCAVYLIFALLAGIIFLSKGTDTRFLLFGIMTLVLCFGDAFHLIPRIIKNIKGESEKVKWWMNLGNLITSITMTIFYIILFYLWVELNPTIRFSKIIPIAIWVTTISRIVLCLLPQNKWFSGGNFKMSAIRNLVFCATGFIMILLFLIQGLWYGRAYAMCILFSFIFYIPVALFAKENPKLGMLMIPKTICYIVLISLGFYLI